MILRIFWKISRPLYNPFSYMSVLYPWQLSWLSCHFAETVRKEAATVAAVFPSPDAVMGILVQVRGLIDYSLMGSPALSL